MKLVAHILFVIIVGAAHWLFAAMLIFFGTVINPTAQHAILGTTGFLLLLPFSPLIFGFPEVFTPGRDAWLAFASGLCWAELYWQVGSRCIRRLKQRRLRGTSTA